MKLNDYQKFAARTMNPDLTDTEALINMSLGLAGETGEIIEHVKKVLFHGNVLDEEYLKKEIGDVLWYVAGIASVIGLDLADIAQTNQDKLQHRYPDGFTVKKNPT